MFVAWTGLYAIVCSQMQDVADLVRSTFLQKYRYVEKAIMLLNRSYKIALKQKARP